MTEKKTNILVWTVFYKGQEVKIDLSKKAPIEILEEKTKPMWSEVVKRKTPEGKWESVRYLPSFILRQIFIKMWFKKEVVKVEAIHAPEYWILYNMEVEVQTPDGEILSWFSWEYVGKGKITKASLWAVKAIESRAIKDALRWKYPFFTMDWDFTEDELEKTDYQDSSVEEIKKADKKAEWEKIKIEEAFTSLGKALDLEPVDINKMITQFKWNHFMTVYNKLKPILIKWTVNNRPIADHKKKLLLIDNIKKLYDTDLLIK